MPQTSVDKSEKARQKLASLRLSYYHEYVIVAVIGVLVLRRCVIAIYRYRQNSTFVASISESSESGWTTSASKNSPTVRFCIAAEKRGQETVWRDWSWIQFTLSLSIIAFNIAFSLIISSTSLSPQTPYSNYSRAITRRIGRVATQNIPLLFALMGRSSPVAMLTGISYQDLRFYHRLIGVIVVIETFIHVLGQTLYYVVSLGVDELAEEYTELYFKMGILGVAGVAILFTFSFRRFGKHYELFLISHILGAAMFLSGLFYHEHVAENWVIAAAAFWIFERVARLVRTIFSSSSLFNIHLRQPLVRCSSAKIVDGAVLLKIPFSGKWTAGQHMYLTFYGKLIGQSHPFSIVNLPSSAQELHFVFKVFDGATQTLARQIQESSNYLPMVQMEGPYGGPVNVAEQFDSVLLVAGGSGITHLSSVLSNLVQKKTEIAVPVSSVELVWAVQHRVQISWVQEQLDETVRLAKLAILDLNISVYVTRPEDDDTNSEKSIQFDEKSQDEKYTSTGIRFYRGRPVLSTIISEAIDNSVGRTIVVACGPDSMTRDVRTAALLERNLTVEVASFEC